MTPKVEMNGAVPVIKLNGHIFTHYFSGETKEGHSKDKFVSNINKDLKIVMISKTKKTDYHYSFDGNIIDRDWFDELCQ